MKINRMFWAIMITVCTLIAFGVVLLVSTNKDFDDMKKSVTVSADGVTQETLEIKDLSLVPGDKVEYEISLTITASATYHLTLDFSEEKDGGLKQFVNTTIKLDEKEVSSDKLSAFLSGKKMDEKLAAEEGQVLSLKIIYDMGIEVGDEAQETYSDFDVALTIEVD